MNKINALDGLRPITEEMLAGLQADQDMKRRIRLACDQRRARHMPRRAFAPALCCAAAAVLCVGLAMARTNEPMVSTMSLPTATEGPVEIDTIAAGEAGMPEGGIATAALAPGAMVRSVQNMPSESLFAEGEGDIPLVTLGGGVYRMLKYPEALDASQLGGVVGAVASVTDQPSLAGQDAMSAGLSNVAGEGATLYAIAGLSELTAVAAEVDGQMRLFQRVSYAGHGPGGQGIEDTMDVRGKVDALELSGVGAVTGEKADAVIATLLDSAVLVRPDAAGGSQILTITLDSGLQFELGVSGDTVLGCGAWSCPEFFDAFDAAK